MVEPFRARPLSAECPDAMSGCGVRHGAGRHAGRESGGGAWVTADGDRHVLGVDAGASEDGAFWTAFLGSLAERALRRVRFLTSDAHEGLKHIVRRGLRVESRQRCRVHFMQNLLALLTHGPRDVLAAIVRTVPVRPDSASALAQLQTVVEGLQPRCAQDETLLTNAAEAVLGRNNLPAEHRTRLHSTHASERLNNEIKRRSNVGILPNLPGLLHVVGAILTARDDEWAVAHRRYFSAEFMRQLRQALQPTTTQELPTAFAPQNSPWMSVETRGAVCRGARRVPSAFLPQPTNSELARTVLHRLNGHYRFCALRRVSSRRSALDIQAAITEAGDA